MQLTPNPYWFYAKTYGWGWGLPARWEGWVVLGVWLAITTAGGAYLAAKYFPLFFVFMLVMVIALVAVCWWKGEPPRWRWGKSRQPE